MTAFQVTANDAVATSSRDFVAVPDMVWTLDFAYGDLVAMFSCVVQPEQATAILMRVMVNGEAVGEPRELKIDVFSARTERVFSVEQLLPGTDATDVVTIEWRVRYGAARIGDRRMTLLG